jgi:DNA polymerase III epsilon subunit-like protein
MCRFVSDNCQIAGLSPQKGRIVEIAAMELESGDSMQTLVNIAPAVVRSSSPEA